MREGMLGVRVIKEDLEAITQEHSKNLDLLVPDSLSLCTSDVDVKLDFCSSIILLCRKK